MLGVPEPVSLNLTKAIERSNPTTSRGAGSSSHTQFLASFTELIFILY
jgi:hypothetical protein